MEIYHKRGRPKINKPIPNPYESFISKIIELIVGQNKKFVSGWNIQEENGVVVFKIQFKLINQQILENILSFIKTQRYQMRMYPEEYSIILEIKINKQQA